MKLTNAQAANIAEQTGAFPVQPEESVNPDFAKVFGDHTFFVVQNGLVVLEPIPGEQSAEGTVLGPILIATWAGNQEQALRPSEPLLGSQRIVLKAA